LPQRTSAAIPIALVRFRGRLILAVGLFHFLSQCPLMTQSEHYWTSVQSTKADAQKVVKIISGDKAKTQSYCDMTKLDEQIKQAKEKRDNKTEGQMRSSAGFITTMCGFEFSVDTAERGQPQKNSFRGLDQVSSFCKIHGTSISRNGPTFAVKTHARVLSDRAALGTIGRFVECLYRRRDLPRNDFVRGHGRGRHRLRVRLCG
jgi:hypothetical protein